MKEKAKGTEREQREQRRALVNMKKWKGNK